MTLLTICQDIASEAKVKVPDTIISNGELEAKQLLIAAKRTIQDLLIRVDWEELQAEATVTTIASTESYSLPNDFKRIINGTAWNNTRNHEMLGVVSGQEWQDLKNRTSSSSSVIDYYRIRGGAFLIFPTPSSVESMIYEYIQNTPVESSGAVAQTDWLADADVPRIDAYLVELGTEWRFRKANGKPYKEAATQYNQMLFALASQDGGRRTIRPRFSASEGIIRAYPENVEAPV